MIVIAVNPLLNHNWCLSSDTLTQAKKQGIKRKQEEDEAAERDRQLRLAGDQEAKVSNVVVFIVYATN